MVQFMKLKGFSLAETLCMLIVISVVALLFWQTVYMTYTKQKAATKIKHFQSVMKQVQLKAKKDYNDWDDYCVEPDSVTAERFASNYILPYVTYLKKDTEEEGKIHIYLADSTSFYLQKTSCMTFILDINGDLPPNIQGKDLFYFNYCPYNDSEFAKQGDFIPFLTKTMTSRDAALLKCASSPMYCSGFISFDNFDFSDDYPFRIPG